MIGKTTNKLLQTTERKMEAKVKPEFRTAFLRVVTAGMKLMYDPQTRGMVTQQLKSQGSPAQVVGEGIAKLMLLLMSKSKGTMPPQAMIPAATVLLCEGLDFAEKAGMVRVDKAMIASAMQEMTSALMQGMKITPDRLSQMAQKAQTGAVDTTPPPAAPPPAPAPAGGIVAQVQGGAA